MEVKNLITNGKNLCLIRIGGNIIDVMHNGADIPYKSVSSRVKMVNGQLVQVTYKKLPDGIRISDAWVK